MRTKPLKSSCSMAARRPLLPASSAASRKAARSSMAVMCGSGCCNVTGGKIPSIRERKSAPRPTAAAATDPQPLPAAALPLAGHAARAGRGRAFLQLLHELLEVRLEGGEQGVVLLLQHHFAEQLQAHGERRGGLLVEVAPAAHAAHDGDDVVMIAHLELQRLVAGTGAGGVGQVLQGYAVTVLFHDGLLGCAVKRFRPP